MGIASHGVPLHAAIQFVSHYIARAARCRTSALASADDGQPAFRAWEYWGFSWKPKCNRQSRYAGRMVPGSTGWNVLAVVGGRWALGTAQELLDRKSVV